MPIYAYRCGSCGLQKDVLQKLSDAPLAICPSCGESTFAKQLSAPAFQLKGTGWYVTDFRDNGKKSDGSSGDGKSEGSGKGAGETAPAAGSGDAPAAAPSPAPAAASPAPAPSPAPSAGSSPAAKT